MIRKMRWKVVGVTMAVVTAVLLTALVAVFLSSRTALESRTRSQLQQALQGDPFGPWRPGQETASPGAYFTVEVFAGGTVRIVDSGFLQVDDEETILSIVNDCLQRQEDYGLLSDYNLRYLRSASALNVRIAFADSTMERETLRSMVGTTVLTGVLAFIVLLGASYLLSGLVTRPVERAWREQQRFLSDASHELKTPLTVILSSADLLAESPMGEEQTVYTENIRSESRRMKKLVESMLTLSRADDGEHKLVFSTVDWSDVVTDTALRFEPVAFEANRTLCYNIQENLFVTGDADRLRQLTAILLDNAIKYAPVGDPVRLLLTKESSAAHLTVENGGAPIPPEVRSHLFDRFYRADSARSGSEGFGLGLSIAQSIVLQHRGTIRCESDERSTRFIVTLPLKK
ncbi:MAG: HAMP domain-containing histidine kinase [Oscillospiraceae bacterium]|nr:HAMP domain-containing histidine kinase [Oscillospiraceae bacterium]